MHDPYDPENRTEWESRFQAIVSNTPGLVFQCRLQAEGAIDYPYLSEGCVALLGLSARELHEQPARLLALVLPEDRDSFLSTMRHSAASGTAWNWEGRILVAQWNDIKWVNLRGTPRPPAGGTVLWDGIMSNITQSKLEEAEIKRSRMQLAELSAHVEKVKEEERTRIAREIHDDLGGNLTAIKMALALLVRRLPPKTEREVLEKATYVDALVDRTLESVHRIAGDLRPGVLDFGIVAAIEWQAREFEKQTGIPCQVHAEADEPDFPPVRATALFRVFQEALTNISKHAGASRVRVDMRHTAEELRLRIADNGKGMSPADRGKPQSFGIRGMQERIGAMGGEVTFESHNGCVVNIRIPLALT